MLVVIAEDDQELRGLMLDVFRDAGCETEAFDNGAAAFEFLKQKRPASDALLVTDLMMPEMDGVELVRKLAEQGIRIPTVVVSGYLNEKVKARMERFGAMAVLGKPVEVGLLQGLIEQAASFQPSAPAVAVEPEPEPPPSFPVREQEAVAEMQKDEATSEKALGPATAEAAQSEDLRPEAAESEHARGEAGAVEATAGAERPETNRAPAEKPVEQEAAADTQVPVEEADEPRPAETAGQARPRAQEPPAQMPPVHAPTQIIDRARLVGAVEGERVRVLVADDDVEFASLLSEALEQEGYSVSVVHDGGAAIQKALAEDFYLLFVDVMMPGLDGVKAIQRIRSAEPGLLMVAVTGKAGPADAARAMQAGAFQVLYKPLDMEELRARLAEWSLVARRRRVVTGRYAAIKAPRRGFFSVRGKAKRLVLLVLLLLVLAALLMPGERRLASRGLAAVGDGLVYLKEAALSVFSSGGEAARNEPGEAGREGAPTP